MQLLPDRTITKDAHAASRYIVTIAGIAEPDVAMASRATLLTNGAAMRIRISANLRLGATLAAKK
jgi:hypothetical protein